MVIVRLGPLNSGMYYPDSVLKLKQVKHKINVQKRVRGERAKVTLKKDDI